MRVFGTSEDWIINKRWIMHKFFKSQEKIKAVSWRLGGAWVNGEPKAMPGTH